MSEATKSMLIAIVFGVFGLGAIAAISLLDIKTDKPIALVFPASYSADQSIAALSKIKGEILGFGGSDNILVGRFEQSQLTEILRKTGAVITLNAQSTSICAIKK